ncbi:MAG: methyltransferase domain-containing protein [Pseudooceanicola sp.]|nr:methyltransferase domain-containing protein [Pseudooceanicola sp.]
MTTPPILFDRPALAAHRARVKDEALFLHHAARDEVEDRLTLVNRAFTAAAVVTPFPQVWQGVAPVIVPDDEVLALQAGAHDLVIHAMALHWANDPVGQIIQCRRALKPDGLFLCVVPGGQTLHELRSVLAEAESQVSGGLSPRVAPMGEIRDLGALLQRAGLALPVADLVPLTVAYRDLAHLMHDLRAMGETNALASRRRGGASRALFDVAGRLYAEHFSDGAGRLLATFELICLTAWAPDASQPQPLRPGSAKARLADALRVPETRLPD